MVIRTWVGGRWQCGGGAFTAAIRSSEGLGDSGRRGASGGSSWLIVAGESGWPWNLISPEGVRRASPEAKEHDAGLENVMR